MNYDHIGLLDPIIARVRTDVHGKRTPKGNACIKSPLTRDILAKHLNGAGMSYGAYLMEAGSDTTRIALFDFDSHKGETPWPEMQAAALRVMSAAESAGLRPHPFRSSGGRGIHLILLWEDAQDSYSVRQTMRDVLSAAQFEDGTAGVAAGYVEVFPKQDVATSFGHMFILPLGGKSVQLDTFELEDMPRYAPIDWQMSAPVAKRERSVRDVTLAKPTAELTLIKSMLDAIPNSGERELPYEDRETGRSYLNVLFAVHFETKGADDGLALIHDWASRHSRYSEAKTDADWRDAGKSSATPVTVGSLRRIAQHYGWSEDVTEQFAVVEAEKDSAGQVNLDLPPFERNKKGAILATIGNVEMALRASHVCMVHIGFDQFKDALMIAQYGTQDWRAFTDADYTRLRIGLAVGGFQPISREMIKDAVKLVATDNLFDSAQTWLATLPAWDGVPRVAQFLADYMGAARNAYTEAVSLYLWTALAGRVIQPGVKADMVPILVGLQGIGKSTVIGSMVPSMEYFVEISLGDKEDNLSRMMRGALIAEIAELRGLQTRELEAVKAFITRTHEKWIPKYAEFSQTFARRLVFIGTTNQDEFLADETGNRRWLPVNVSAVDVAGVARDRLQLWAEGAEMFRNSGVRWQDAQRLGAGQHESFMVQDAWEAAVTNWIESMEKVGEDLTSHQVLIGALNFQTAQIKKSDEMRLARVLKACGYVRATRWRGGKAQKVWSFEK